MGWNSPGGQGMMWQIEGNSVNSGEGCPGTWQNLIKARDPLWIRQQGQRQRGAGEVVGYEEGAGHGFKILYHSIDHGLYSVARRQPSEMSPKAFLRYDSYTIQLTLSKPTIQWFLVYSQSAKLLHNLISEHSHGSKRHLVSIGSHASFPDTGRQLLICFLSLRICLFWTFHIHQIIWHVVFWDWLLHLV